MSILESIAELTTDTFGMFETNGVFCCTVETGIVLIGAIALIGFAIGNLFNNKR